MGNVELIRVAAGIGFLVVLYVFLRRGRKREY